MSCLHTCLHACTPLECTKRIGEAIESFGTGLADGGKLSYWSWECRLGPLEEQPTLSTAKASLQPPLVAFSSHTVFTILAAVRLVNMKPTYTFKYKAYWYPQIWHSLMLPKYEVCQYTQIIWSPLIIPNMKPFHDSQIKSANFFIVLSEMKVLTSERKDVGLLISCICHAFASKLFPLSLPSSLLS